MVITESQSEQDGRPEQFGLLLLRASLLFDTVNQLE